MLEKLRSGEPLTAKEKLIHDQGLVTVLRQIHDELDEAVLEAYGWGDLRSRDIPVANKEAPHSCGAGESAADAPREALSPAALLSPSRQECRDSLLPPAGRERFEDALITRLVALNHERTAEEKRGLIRWLRPDYQNPTVAVPQPVQPTLTGTDPDSSSTNQKFKINSHQSSTNPTSSFQWPDRLPDQVAILRKLITTGDRNVAAPYDAESLSALFGRKNKKRTEQIKGILETLKGLGQL